MGAVSEGRPPGRGGGPTVIRRGGRRVRAEGSGFKGQQVVLVLRRAEGFVLERLQIGFIFVPSPVD